MQSKILFLFFALLASFSVDAQRNCGTMEVYHRQLQEDPGFQARREAIERFTEQYIATSGEVRTVYTIPVVVHVVWNTSTQNISDAQIQSQITVLNNDFRKLNADISNVPSVFAGLAADAEINFCMAARDPSGNATTGIVRKQTTKASFSTNDAVKYSAQGGDDAWNSSQYLNLWVCNLSGGVLGYAQFPGGAAATDGVVIAYTAFGNTGTAAAPYDKGRTATHEIGHWLNLYHIWGDDGTACTGTDQVSDTPNQASENYGCPSFPHVSCSNGPNGDMFMNYMDYTDDACMYMYTTGQKSRIQATMAGTRASLASSPGCQPPSGGGCTAPSGLAASGITNTSATLSWSAVSGAVSYNLQYQAAGATTWTTVPVTSTSYNLSGLTAGATYNFQVQTVCSTGSSSYSAASSFTTTGGTACTDTYEPNESRTAAKAITVNVNTTAKIGTSTDKDWFKFSNTTANKNIRVTLTNLPLDYDLRLYNSSGSLLYTSQNSGTTSESIIYNNAPVSTYYIQVYGYNNAYSNTQCYTLNASISGTAFRLDGSEVEALAPDKDGFSLYPNPVTGSATIELSVETETPTQIRVNDITGSLVMQRNVSLTKGANQTELDMATLPSGMYIVSVLHNGKLMAKKVIKQ